MGDPYDGRTIDVLVLRGQQPTGDALLSQDWLEGGGQVATGVVKLAQWAVSELLKERGSQPFDPHGGTTFFTKLLNGWLRTETDVFVAFGFAVGDIQARAAQVEPAGIPADEAFSTWVLDRVAVAPGSVQLHTTLATKAGGSRRLILPIPLTTR